MTTPALFVLGDSISIDYGPALECLLAGRFAYNRKGYAFLKHEQLDSTLINGGDSQSVHAFLQSATGQLAAADSTLVLNCGLHDLRVYPQTGARQVGLEQYISNLEKIISLARSLCRKVVWVQTTPVVDEYHNRLNPEFHRFNADVIAYNTGAEGLMRNADVPVLDLYRFTLGMCESPDKLVRLYRDHVHFLPEVSRLQAACLAGWLEAFEYA